MANDAELFRQSLLPALELWVAEELISPAHAKAIRAYYRTDEAPIRATRTFSASLRGTGAVVAGLGLLALGAANWEAIPIDVRLGLAVAVLVLASLIGFALLNDPKKAAWGRAALITASFALGASAATVAQRWQIGGDGGEVWGAWALGTLLMAWAAGAGGVAGVAAFALTGFAFTAGPALAWLAPWGFALGLLPLAYRLDLRPLLYVALGGIFLTLMPVCPGPGEALLVANAAIAGLLGWQVWHVRRLPFQALSRAVIRREPGDALFALSEAEQIRKGACILALLTPPLAALLIEERGLFVAFDELTWPAGLTLTALVLGAFALWAHQADAAASVVAHRVLGCTALLGLAVVLTVPPTAWSLAAFYVSGIAASLAIAYDGLRLGERNWFWTGVVACAWGVVLFLVGSEGEPLALGVGLLAGALVVAGASWLLDRQLAARQLGT